MRGVEACTCRCAPTGEGVDDRCEGVRRGEGGGGERGEKEEEERECEGGEGGRRHKICCVEGKITILLKRREEVLCKGDLLELSGFNPISLHASIRRLALETMQFSLPFPPHFRYVARSISLNAFR